MLRVFEHRRAVASFYDFAILHYADAVGHFTNNSLDRFILERTIDNTYIQFGFGSEDQITSDTVVDPSQVVLSLQTKNYVTDISFDPTNIVKTDKLGVGPSNTTLRVKYLENDDSTSNSPAANVKTVSSLKIRFRDRLSLSNNSVSEVANSVEVNNEEPIVGEVSELETDEIKIKTLDVKIYSI